MDRIITSELAPAEAPGPDTSKRHFDTFETQFFKQGDEAEVAPQIERFDDLDEGKRKRFAPSRQLVAGVAVGSACLAVIGCVALWRSGSHPSSTAHVAAAAEPIAAPKAAHAAVAVPENAAAPVAAPASETAAALPPAQAPSGASPAAAPTASAAVPAPVSPPAPPAAAPAAHAPAPAAGEPAPSPSVAHAEPAVVAAAAEKPSPSTPPVAPAAANSPAPSQAHEPKAAPEPDQPAASVGQEASTTRSRCKQAVKSRRAKDILSACEDAFAADPGAADIAILLAKTEFDKGRSAQAVAWSKKALAVDPRAADAYVFIGGAEQNAGRNKAAKEAYRHYLDLAPTGHYAADLRAIVGSL